MYFLFGRLPAAFSRFTGDSTPSSSLRCRVKLNLRAAEYAICNKNYLSDIPFHVETAPGGNLSDFCMALSLAVVP